MTSSIKPEIHNISQRRQRRTNHGHKYNTHKTGHLVPEICSRTDRQTDTLITILYSPIRGVVRMMNSIVCIGPIAVALELPYAQQLGRLIGQLPYCYRPSLITGKHTILYEMLF